jgi:O-acetyl-ADP-ribose deacetylase (regulator of RNase III)
MIDAWKIYFRNISEIEIIHESIFNIKSDAIVSPANSFGFMDGGLDLQISKFFGWHVQERLQKIIKEKYHGELLIGCAEIIETDHKDIPYVISAPTMRVPMILRDSVNIYLATRAIIILAKNRTLPDGTLINQKVKKIAIPGMGTGVGRVPYVICASQMKTAVDDYFYDKYTFPKSWYEAQQKHQILYGKKPRDLQF